MNHDINQTLAKIRNDLLSIANTHMETEVNTNQQTAAPTTPTTPAAKALYIKAAEIRAEREARLANAKNKAKAKKPRTYMRKTITSKVLKIMRTTPDMRPVDVAALIGCHRRSVHSALFALRKKGIIPPSTYGQPKAQTQEAAQATQETQGRETPAANRLGDVVQAVESITKAKTFGHLVLLSPIKTALSHFTMYLITSGNADLVKNHHFQTLLKLTTTSEGDQL